MSVRPASVAAGSARADSRGFTLLEVVVVVFIMALVASVVMVRLPDLIRLQRDPVAQVRAEFQYFAEHAVLHARPVALSANPGGYRFSEWLNGQWVEVPRPDFLPEPETRTAFFMAGSRSELRGDGIAIADALGDWPSLDVELRRGGVVIERFALRPDAPAKLQ